MLTLIKKDSNNGDSNVCLSSAEISGKVNKTKGSSSYLVAPTPIIGLSIKC